MRLPENATALIWMAMLDLSADKTTNAGHVSSSEARMWGPAEDAPAPVRPAPLIDPFQRAITYLRISVTDRCDFRCAYCMAEDMQFLPKRDLLTLEELDRLCGVFIDRGVRKLRITGGEPLVRRDIMHLFRRLSRHLRSGALDELTLTTNGSNRARSNAYGSPAHVGKPTVTCKSFNRSVLWSLNVEVPLMIVRP